MSKCGGQRRAELHLVRDRGSVREQAAGLQRAFELHDLEVSRREGCGERDRPPCTGGGGDGAAELAHELCKLSQVD